MGSEILYEDLRSVIDKQSQTLSKFDLQFLNMKAHLIGKYSLLEEAEKEGVEEGVESGAGKNTPYRLIKMIEAIGEPLEIVVGLCGRVNNLAVHSLIPHTVMEEYVQLVRIEK